jgi:pimeloyl-ACP methyl ester carboxylesterase
MLRREFASTPSGALHVQRCGQQGPTLLLLQVLPIGVRMLTNVMTLLAQSGLRCVAIDLLGYGLSDRRNASWLIADFADNIEQALMLLDVRPDYVLGGHFAGMVAAEIALGPNSQVKRLVLDGVPLWPATVRRNIETEMGLKPVQMNEDGSYLSYFWTMARGMLRTLAPEIGVSARTAPFIHEVVQGFLKTAFQPDVLPAMAAHDMAARICDIQIPTLVISSENDTQLQWFGAHLAGNSQAIGHCFAGTHPLHDLTAPERARDYATVVSRFFNGSMVA